MTTKIRIYRDSGANIRPLDEYKNNIIYYQYPYDSKYRPKKNTPRLSVPSALQSGAAQQLILTHSGPGRLVIAGDKAPLGMFNISGDGSIQAGQLIIDTLMLKMSGKAYLACTLQGLASGSLSGSSNFNHYGQGNATGLRTSGSAKYKQVE